MCDPFDVLVNVYTYLYLLDWYSSACLEFIEIQFTLLLSMQMAITALAHVFVFSVKPYRFILVSDYEKISTRTEKTLLDIEKGKQGGYLSS